jgi:hypothetical protein
MERENPEMALLARRYKVRNSRIRQAGTRTLHFWRFAIWRHESDVQAWRLEIHVKDSPDIVVLDRHGWFRQSFDWFYYWRVRITLGKVGISYDGNSHRRQGWQMRRRLA